jgi:hypothetical protein
VETRSLRSSPPPRTTASESKDPTSYLLSVEGDKKFDIPDIKDPAIAVMVPGKGQTPNWKQPTTVSIRLLTWTHMT